MGKSGPIRLPTSSHLGQSGGEVPGLPVQQEHTAQSAQYGYSTIQPDPTQESVKPESICLAPRATAIKEQGFSETVSARIEAPQRGSTISVYEANLTIFLSGASVIRWPSGHHLLKP